MLVWDPRKAHQKGVVLEEGKDLISRLTHNIRESALFELAQLNYDVDTFQSSAINRLKPSDGSDWSQEQKKKFHSEVFRLRRDLRSVSKAMGVPLKTCHAYYLGTYKSTCEYRLLKTVCIGERESNATNVEEDACAICGDGGSLLICDGCEGEYHMTCMQPPLRVVPEGHWLCDECVDRRVLEARAFFIRHSTLFDEVVVNMPNNKKRFADQLHGDTKHASISNVATMENLDGSGEVFYRPVDPFVEAAREFSRNISKVFSKTGDD